MIIPDKLNKGDKVALVATARHISLTELEPAINILKEWGLTIVMGNNILNKENQFAGTDRQRVDDFQSMIDDDSIKAVICSRGGYGTARIIDLIDFTNLIKHPKWIIGYSDITVLHSHINNIGIASLHSTMPINFSENTKECLETLYNCLFLASNNISCHANSLNRKGNVSGEIVGGNLSVIYSLLGSATDLDTRGKILFIEDLDEYLYHIDRMILNLKRNNKFTDIKALIVGGMKDMHDNSNPFGKSANEIVYEHIKDYDFPVCFDFPAGHMKNNQSIIFGKKSDLDINKEVILTQ